MSSTWTNLIAQVAPTIATVLGGPLAGMGVKALSTAILGHANGTQDDIEAAIPNITPEQLLALKQADNAFKAQMAELGIEPDKLDVEDRESARDMAKSRGFTPQVVLSGMFVGGYFVLLILFLLGYTHLDPSYKDLLLTLIGVLTAGIPQILNFWFGSSHGSQKKDDALAQAALS